MIKQTITKIISGLILFVFVVSFFQFALPARADVLNDNLTVNIGELFNNPNQATKNDPYKFSLKVLKSGILQNVIGCTGVVNTVATWMSKLLNSKKLTQALQDRATKALRDQLLATCAATKASVQGGAGATPTVNDLVTPVSTIFSKIGFKIGGVNAKLCADTINALSDDELKQMKDDADAAAAVTLKEQCFDGIAITLAKNQLTSMTRSAMNWVNTGFGGNPLFVQNMTNFTNDIERNVIETGTDILLDKAFGGGNQNPYARDFAISAVASRGIKDSSAGLLGNLQSTLGSFITDPQSFYTNGQLDQAQDTRSALQRAQDANNAFANDFSSGGWNGWLALTQQDQNNPLGFTMLASQYLADEQAQKVSDAKAELVQNNGFLSQKTCILWQEYDEKGNPKYKEGGFSASGLAKSSFTPTTRTTPPATCYKPGGDCCVDWKIITPGSIIKDKVTNYLNSPERQLELVKTINDGINALFGVLISQLENAGLSGLSDSTTNPANWTDTMNNDLASLDGNTPYDNNGAYDNFNLTRDLGNNYTYATPISLGEWNAKTNTAVITNTDYPKEGNKGIHLYPNTAPEVYKKNVEDKFVLAPPVNSYFTVTTAGNFKLISEGYNGWVKGDRAFWNGSEWQNWQKDQTNPIKKRGVIQIQQDYIVAATEILGVLDRIMPKLGELDYCIPGPNPSYLTNSTDAQSAYQDWIGSMYVGTVDSTGNRHGVKIDQAGDRTYDNFKNIFSDNSGVWNTLNSIPKTITGSIQYLIEQFSNICNDKTKWWTSDEEEEKNCAGSYFFAKTLSKEDTDHLNQKKDLMDTTQDYVNSSLFQNFYSVFDTMMNKLYFNNMTSVYNEYENRPIVPKGNPNDINKGYIPMAESGLALTKNIIYYNEDITKLTQEYKDGITTAKTNIAKLEPIKAEVSAIIKAAQDRRDKELLDKINGIGNNSLVGENGNGVQPKLMTMAEYKAKYADCLAEENMNFFDADTIMNIGGATAERCSNGIDDDLDGLIDMKDPDCQINTCKDGIDNDGDKLIDGNDPDCKVGGIGKEGNDNTPGNCSKVENSETQVYIDADSQRQTEYCSSFKNRSQCEGGKEYINGNVDPQGFPEEWDCEWTPS